MHTYIRTQIKIFEHRVVRNDVTWRCATLCNKFRKHAIARLKFYKIGVKLDFTSFKFYMNLRELQNTSYKF